MKSDRGHPVQAGHLAESAKTNAISCSAASRDQPIVTNNRFHLHVSTQDKQDTNGQKIARVKGLSNRYTLLYNSNSYQPNNKLVQSSGE